MSSVHHLYLLVYYTNQLPCDVCAALTSLPASFWKTNHDDCIILLENHAYSHITRVAIIFSLVWIQILFCIVLVRCCCIRPIIQHVKSTSGSQIAILRHERRNKGNEVDWY